MMRNKYKHLADDDEQSVLKVINTGMVIMWFHVAMAYLSIVVLGISFVHLSGITHDSMNFISTGFLNYSVASSFIYGISAFYILTARTVGVVMHISSRTIAVVLALLILCTITSQIGTVRYDELKNSHAATAALWIISSLGFHAIVIFSNTNVVYRVVLGINVVATLIFLTGVLLHIDSKDDTTWFMVGVCEYITSGLILVMDAILLFHIHTKISTMIHQG